ncbi:MAG: hypothetical protein ABIK07_10700 [Planctomycetota bacterium]
MNSYRTVQSIGVCLDKVLQNCGSEARQGSTFIDVHFLKPFLAVDIVGMSDEDVLETVRDYCYEIAGKFREAGMNVQKQLDESGEKSLSEILPPNVHFAI